MTEDGKNKGKSVADAIEETAAPDDDATVQISGTELAAIRQSATSMELSTEELRQINRKRNSAPDDAGEADGDDATRTFDRNQLDAMMARKEEHEAGDPAKVRAAVEEARNRANLAENLAEDSAEEFDDTGLDDWSEADMRAIVFGDTPAGGQLAEQTPRPASEPPHQPSLDEPSPDEPGTDEPGTEADEEFDELSDDDLDELSDGDLEELSGAEFDELARDLSDAALEEGDEPPLDELLPEQPAPTQTPTLDEPAPANLSDVEEEEALASFRGAESRLLLVGGTLATLAMLVVGSMRLWGDGYFTAVHPVIAGMFIAVGLLCLGGGLIAVLQGRS